VLGLALGFVVSAGGSTLTMGLVTVGIGLLFLLFPGFVLSVFDRIPPWLARILDVI
jgi:uncharacterized membrane protein YesL